MAKSWLNDENSDKYLLLAEGTNIRAFSQYYTNELTMMKQSLKIVSAGIEIGEVKGKDLIPNHALAMCTSLLCREAFAMEEISYEQAITYLRKEAITLPATAPRGYVLLTYRHIPLGFVKNSAIVPIIFIRKNGASVVDTYQKIYASCQKTLLIKAVFPQVFPVGKD